MLSEMNAKCKRSENEHVSSKMKHFLPNVFCPWGSIWRFDDCVSANT